MTWFDIMPEYHYRETSLDIYWKFLWLTYFHGYRSCVSCKFHTKNAVYLTIILNYRVEHSHCKNLVRVNRITCLYWQLDLFDVSFPHKLTRSVNCSCWVDCSRLSPYNDGIARLHLVVFPCKLLSICRTIELTFILR